MRANQTRQRPGPGKAKLVFVAVVFALVWLGLWGRAAHIQLVQGPRLEELAARQNLTSEHLAGQRGKILDRSGQILATSVEAKSVFVRPQEIEDQDRATALLAEVLGMDRARVVKLLNKSSKFVWVKRQITDREAMALAEAGLPGVHLTEEYIRLYPQGHLAGQVLGFVGVDGTGLEGLEQEFENQLAGGSADLVVHRDATGNKLVLDASDMDLDVDGRDLTLTLDVHIQGMVEQALARAVKDFKARYGVAVVIHVPTGELLALANCPFFNPNDFRSSSAVMRRDRAALDIVEPGSIMKPFLMAAALEEKVVTPDRIFDCELGKYKVGPYVIRDHHAYGWLTTSEVLRYSSNIGASKVALELGAERYHHYLRLFGLGDPTGLTLPAEASGTIRPWQEWSDFDLAASGFGHGIGVTALQMAQGYLALANHGVKRPLKLVKGLDSLLVQGERVVSQETADTVMEMMRGVVELDGTARSVRIPGVPMAGKTGTAQKASKAGGYGEKYLSSFVALLPADEPELLILVMIDEPEPVNAGAKVAAPVVREIATSTLAYWGRLPDPTQVPLDAVAEPAVDAVDTDLALVEPAAGEFQAEKPAATTAQVDLSEVRVAPEQAAVIPAMTPGKFVPELSGLPVRRVLELLAQKGIIPVIKGHGSTVVGQHPDPGEPWPEPKAEAANPSAPEGDEDDNQGGNHVFILWVS